MKIIHTTVKSEVVNALRFDILLIITSSCVAPLAETVRVLDLYMKQGFINNYEGLSVACNKVSVTVYCPGKVNIEVNF